jgi:hypothetical protein
MTDQIPAGFEPDTSYAPDSQQSNIPPGFEPDTSGDDTDQSSNIPAGFSPEGSSETQPSEGSLSAPTAALASFTRHATLGASDAAARGLRAVGTALGTSPENLHYWAPAPEQLEQAKEEHPTLSAFAGFGGDLVAMSMLPNVVKGSKAIAGAIQGAAMAGGDEFSKSMLGVGDPALGVIGHIAAGGAGGLLLGGILGSNAASTLTEKATRSLENKFGSKALNYIGGAGHILNGGKVASSTEEALQQMQDAGISPNLFDAKNWMTGQKEAIPAMQNYIQRSMAVKGAGLGATAGYNLMGPQGLTYGTTIGGYLGNMLGSVMGKKFGSKAGEMVVGPILTKMAASGSFNGVAKAVDYGLRGAKGYNLMSKGVDSLFQSAAGEGLNWTNEQLEKRRQETKDFIGQGGIDKQISEHPIPAQPQGYAEGGEVQPIAELNEPNPIAKHFPEQNMLLNSARTRVSNYLKANKPSDINSGLPYDTKIKDPQKEKDYDQVIDLANNPLSILNKIKSGRLLPKHMSHFMALYPDMHQELSKQITKRMEEGRLKEETKPPYHVRQAMSLFLGSNLDSTLTPQSMMAAQGTFIQQNQKKALAAAKANGLMKSVQNSKTAQQGAESRLNKN